MKVKVSYTVNFDEVPRIVDEMLSDCKQKLLSGSNKLIFSPYNLSEMTRNLNEVREDLLLVENKLEDALNITHGWIQAQEEAGEESEALVDANADEDFTLVEKRNDK